MKNDFHGSLQAWKKLWDHCVHSKEARISSDLVQELSDAPQLEITLDRRISHNIFYKVIITTVSFIVFLADWYNNNYLVNLRPQYNTALYPVPSLTY
jgi:hypothetical protein